ncbi:L-histidine N(alpha)-methyltransferase [Cochleicola gelatinilyticus]|uniref:Dimethylhistidine N-methyltransferase n=1 Tax=Cochleicola gelatinilyticus TaxID=1763537 RepID=A0A167EXQ6_9FLAO|nr:L-histidine N(alpha)-methyltransferase [Cochleicola gelatinilyticus]OAB75982.1 dimethylhistidine N-methyltransferase [Cochleicola gelatinilyticus]
MNITTKPSLDTAFKKEVFQGLTNSPKYLSSKYIYDATGDKLFQDIMALPEYYLTNCEFEILDLHKEAIAKLFATTTGTFDLIELGAGDGKKTKVLLRHFSEKKINFVYKPIDISQNAIDQLSEKLSEELPQITVDAEKGEYFEVLDRLKTYRSRKKVILVLGSNIGNLLHPRAIDFLSNLKDSMGDDDLLFMGFDQKKDPQIILNAYNDPTGVTAAFNKNLLTRINRELGGNFDVSKFKHWERYDPETGTAKSFLVATEAQKVTISELNLDLTFDPWETIHTEISQKYDDNVVEWLASESGLVIETSFSDSKGYYKDYVFRKK